MKIKGILKSKKLILIIFVIAVLILIITLIITNKPHKESNSQQTTINNTEKNNKPTKQNIENTDNKLPQIKTKNNNYVLDSLGVIETITNTEYIKNNFKNIKFNTNIELDSNYDIEDDRLLFYKDCYATDTETLGSLANLSISASYTYDSNILAELIIGIDVAKDETFCMQQIAELSNVISKALNNEDLANLAISNTDIKTEFNNIEYTASETTTEKENAYNIAFTLRPTETVSYFIEEKDLKEIGLEIKTLPNIEQNYDSTNLIKDLNTNIVTSAKIQPDYKVYKINISETDNVSSNLVQYNDNNSNSLITIWNIIYNNDNESKNRYTISINYGLKTATEDIKEQIKYISKKYFNVDITDEDLSKAVQENEKITYSDKLYIEISNNNLYISTDSYDTDYKLVKLYESYQD